MHLILMFWTHSFWYHPPPATPLGTLVGTLLGTHVGTPLRDPLGNPLDDPLGTPSSTLLGTPLETPLDIPLSTPLGTPMGWDTPLARMPLQTLPLPLGLCPTGLPREAAGVNIHMLHLLLCRYHHTTNLFLQHLYPLFMCISPYNNDNQYI